MPRQSPEDRFTRAIRWVEDGLVHIYREKDPVHYVKFYSQIKSKFGIQQDFTFDRRQFQHYWIYSPESGTGKSAIVNALWPYAYVLSNKDYFEGFNPLFGPHRVVVIKDINSRWFLDYGVQEFKQLADLDGHNIDVKYGGGDRVNHGRIVITSNFDIYTTLSGTEDDKIVGFDLELLALRRRFLEIPAAEFIALAGKQLKPKHELAQLSGQQIHDYNALFNTIGPNRIPGYGDEACAEYLRSRPLCPLNQLINESS